MGTGKGPERGTSGTHAGSRRGPRRKATFRPVLLLLALAITACVVAWGYLVYAAVDFGSTARGGDSGAWWFLAIASIGAVACLFFGLMLVALLLRRLGITGGSSSSSTKGAVPADPEPPRPVGGRRAAR